MSPAGTLGTPIVLPADPDLLRQARAIVNRAHVRRLLEDREPDFAEKLPELIRNARCEHASLI